MTDQAYFRKINRLRDRVARRHQESISQALNAYASNNESTAIEESIENLYIDAVNLFYPIARAGQSEEMEKKSVPENIMQRIRRFVQTELFTSIQGIKSYTRQIASQLTKKALAKANRIRAKLIAATESVTASNEAMLSVVDITKKKKWITRNDLKVRALHTLLHNAKVSITGVWYMAGYFVRYPGDPVLPARLRARCRCVMRIV